jgi:hypothetical protein
MDEGQQVWKPPMAGPGEGSADAPWDFAHDTRFHRLFFQDPSPAEIRAFGAWLRGRPQDFVRLYHGTWAGHDVSGEGLRPTSSKRRNSLASSNGYVHLAVHASLARQFGVMASLNRSPAPDGARVAVYPVVIALRRLGPDPGQLFFMTMWGGAAPPPATVATSLIYGQAARVRGPGAALQVSAAERCDIHGEPVAARKPACAPGVR